MKNRHLLLDPRFFGSPVLRFFGFCNPDLSASVYTSDAHAAAPYRHENGTYCSFSFLFSCGTQFFIFGCPLGVSILNFHVACVLHFQFSILNSPERTALRWILAKRSGSCSRMKSGS